MKVIQTYLLLWLEPIKVYKALAAAIGLDIFVSRFKKI